MEPMDDHETAIAILFSGGVDSTALLGRLLEADRRVQPIYVRTGLIWETAELSAARRIAGQLRSRYAGRLACLQVLDLPVDDLYGHHWSITGRGVPDERSDDAAVYLPGRNPLLLVKACLWCLTRDIRQIALGTLAANPFPDATTRFFRAFEKMLLEATGIQMHIVLPFANLTKEELLSIGRQMPLEQTFSCLAPVAGAHCGRCNKCAERHHALATLHPTSAAS